MKEFKLRASASGKLMTNGKKVGDISKTSQSFLLDWLKEQIYGVKKEFSTKETRKGTEQENAAIDKAIEWLDLPFIIKNEKKFEDDYFCGTPDLLLSDTVIDIKTSWDCWTFPLFDEEIPTSDYFYQLQVYMHLTGLKKAMLCYILIDTPETYNSPEISYSHVESKYRIKKYEFAYDENVIKELQNRVIVAREFINTKIHELN